MSYLRGLVRKTRALRPAITPRLPAPPARLGLALDELRIEDTTISSPLPAPPAGPAAAAMPIAAGALPRPTADVVNDDDARLRHQPSSDSAVIVTRAATNSAAELPAPSPRTVSLLSRAVSRRLLAPPSGETAVPDLGEAMPPADRDEHPLVVMTRPPPLEHRLPPPAPRQAAASTLPGERSPERPDVQISIGRLEVRAHITAAAKSERPAPFRPQLSLQDHLAGRSGGRR